MGGAINRSFISVHFLLSAYFLTAWTYKHMRLTTRVYGIRIQLSTTHLQSHVATWSLSFLSYTTIVLHILSRMYLPEEMHHFFPPWK